MEEGKEGGREEGEDQAFFFVILPINYTRSMTCLEELQTKYALRYAKLTNLLVASEVTFLLMFLWQY